MSADALLLRTTTFASRTAWLKSYCDGLRDNTLRLGRSRYTAGETVLTQTDCEIGATYLPNSGILRHYRLDGTGTADDATRAALATPIRGSWHYADNTGQPALDGRVKQGDSYIHDTGSDDRYLLHYDSVAGAFKGLGVLSEYRTAATALSPDQPSDHVAVRASRWDTSGTPAAKYREWGFQAETSASGPDSYSLLSIERRHEGGSWTQVATLDTNGYLFLDGDVPGVELSANGNGAGYVRLTANEASGSRVEFGHGNSARWARYRFVGTTTGDTGAAAEVLSVTFGSDASGGTTTKNSASFLWRGSYWDGAAAQVASFYSQHIIDATTPAGHLRFGSSYGSGTLDLYDDGSVAFLMNEFDSLFTIGCHTRASGGDESKFSGLLAWTANTWDGLSAAVDRSFYAGTQIDSPASANDLYSWNLYSDFSNDPLLTVDKTGYFGFGGTPATRLHSIETSTITGGVTDGYAAGITLEPTYTAASALTVTRHNYIDVKNVVLAGAGPAALTDACFARFNAAAGTHAAVDSGTTKTTPGGVDAWILYNVNGTVYYSPLYTSKTA